MTYFLIVLFTMAAICFVIRDHKKQQRKELARRAVARLEEAARTRRNLG